MWDFLFKNRKLKKEQEKQLAEQKVAALKTELKTIDEKVSAISSANYKKSREEEVNKNSICPKCDSKNVNDRIKRQQGEIKGDFSGSSWTALTFGSGHSSGTIRGSLDTNEVNKCNDCQHEWKKHKASFEYNSKIYTSNVEDVYYILKAYHKAENCTFNALDLNEKYNSFEEKKAALFKEAETHWRIRSVNEFWSGVSIDAFNFLAKKHLNNYTHGELMDYFNEKLLISFGLRKI